MKTKLLLLLSLCFGAATYAQCTTPPPPGLSPVYALDTNNDGYAVFDIQYYIDYYDRPLQESIYGVSSSGYNFVFRDESYNLAPLMFTSATTTGPYPTITQEYTGSGPTFDPLPPCYWPIPGASALQLNVVPDNQDFDNDGILNSDEDTNHNANLMDDDEDNDGVINFRDATNNLATTEFTKVTLNVYPNPVTNAILVFDSNVEITTVIIYDLSGKQVLEIKNNNNSIRVDALAAGHYFVNFQSENGAISKKITIN